MSKNTIKNKRISNIYNLLDEYSSVCIDLEAIKNKIMDLRNSAKEKLLSAKTSKERQEMFLQFRDEIKKIKSDKTIPLKYKNLSKKRETLRLEIVSQFQKSSLEIPTETDIEPGDLIDKDLTFLLKKYSKDEQIIVQNNYDISDFNTDSFTFDNTSGMSSDFRRTQSYNNSDASIRTDKNIVRYMSDRPELSDISDEYDVNKKMTVSDIHYSEQHNEVNKLIKTIRIQMD